MTRTLQALSLLVTFGYKVATWLSAIERHRLRLREMRPRVLVARGCHPTSLGTNGLRVQAGLLAELGLGQPEFAWRLTPLRSLHCLFVAFPVMIMLSFPLEWNTLCRWEYCTGTVKPVLDGSFLSYTQECS